MGTPLPEALIEAASSDAKTIEALERAFAMFIVSSVGKGNPINEDLTDAFVENEFFRESCLNFVRVYNDIRNVKADVYLGQ